MKRTIQKVLFVLLGTFISLSAVAPAVHAAGSATIYLSPANGTYTVGDTISVGIYEDSGSDTINGVQANLSYPTSLLSFASISSSSGFNVDAQDTGGGGAVLIGRGANPPVSGLQLVATVRFTATASGTANISFSNGTAVARSSDNGNESLTETGSSYFINTPAPPPPPPPAPTPPPSPTPPSPRPTPPPSSSSSKPKSSSTNPPATPPPAAPQVLTITSISVSGVSAKSATINWKTSVSATSEVDYGIGTKYIFSAVDNTPSLDHSLPLSPDNLLANTCYHYVIKAVDAKGNQVVSQDQTFATKDNPTCASVTSSAKPSSKKGINWAVIILVLIIVILLIGGGSPPGRRLLRRLKSGTNNNDPGPIGVAPIIMNSPPPGPSGSAPPSTTIRPSTTVMPSADQDGHGTPGSVISPGPKA